MEAKKSTLQISVSKNSLKISLKNKNVLNVLVSNIDNYFPLFHQLNSGLHLKVRPRLPHCADLFLSDSISSKWLNCFASLTDRASWPKPLDPHPKIRRSVLIRMLKSQPQEALSTRTPLKMKRIKQSLLCGITLKIRSLAPVIIS